MESLGVVGTEFAQQFERVEMLAAAPDAAPKLVFEITETAAVTHLEAARDFAADVCALGCGLALDDFGCRKRRRARVAPSRRRSPV